MSETDMWEDTTDALRTERDALRAKVARLEKEADKWRAEYNRLEKGSLSADEGGKMLDRIAALEKELENWRRGTVPDDALEAAMRINWVEMVQRCAALEAKVAALSAQKAGLVDFVVQAQGHAESNATSCDDCAWIAGQLARVLAAAAKEP